MRKRKPQGVRDGFVAEVAELEAYFVRLSSSLAGTQHEQADISRLAETVLLTAVVAFERFTSDLFVAYMNRDFSAFKNDLRSRIRTSVGAKFGVWAKNHVRFSRQEHASLAEIEDLIDSDGWNLVFKTVDEMKDKARSWLATAHARRIRRISTHETRVIETAKALRNFVAHRSKASKVEMNDRLGTVTQGSRNRGLGRGGREIHALGSFLKAYTGGDRRILLYLRRMSDVAARM